MLYAAADLILKVIVWPALTLMSVANPWMEESPEPLMSQVLDGVPGLVFSQATGLTIGGPHGPAACAGRAFRTGSAPSAAATRPPSTRRRTNRTRSLIRWLLALTPRQHPQGPLSATICAVV